MPRWASVILTILSVATLLAAHAEEAVLIEPKVEVGTVFNLDMTVGRQHSEGAETVSTIVTTPVRVEVLEADDSSIVFGWTSGRPRHDAGSTFELEALFRLVEDATLELAYDRDFNLLGIRNLDEVIQFVQKMFDLVGEIGAGDPEMRQAFERVRPMFLNPHTVEIVMADRPARYFSPFGWELVPGVPRTQPTELPNPLGGDPLAATLTVELKPFAADGTHYVFTLVQRIDQQAAERFFRQVIEKLAPDEAEALPGELPPFEIRDEGGFRIHRASGWVDHAFIQRTTTFPMGIERVDSIEFRRHGTR